VRIKVRCIGCKATKEIDRAEATKLSASMTVAMCDACCLPMLAVAVSGRTR
jgi:hypothetical protein